MGRGAEGSRREVLSTRATAARGTALRYLDNLDVVTPVPYLVGEGDPARVQVAFQALPEPARTFVVFRDDRHCSRDLEDIFGGCDCLESDCIASRLADALSELSPDQAQVHAQRVHNAALATTGPKGVNTPWTLWDSNSDGGFVLATFAIDERRRGFAVTIGEPSDFELLRGVVEDGRCSRCGRTCALARVALEGVWPTTFSHELMGSYDVRHAFDGTYAEARFNPDEGRGFSAGLRQGSKALQAWVGWLEEPIVLMPFVPAEACPICLSSRCVHHELLAPPRDPDDNFYPEN